MIPVNVTKPTNPGGDVGFGKATTVAGGRQNYNPTQVQPQVLSFGELVSRCTPRELVRMAELHHQYIPGRPLPEKLQRAIAKAWAQGGAR